MEIVHTPVLLEEAVALLTPPSGEGLLVDATTGEGGHSEAFLARFPRLNLVCLDADPDIQKAAKERLERFSGRARFFRIWAQDFFSAFPPDIERPAGIFIDLGISAFHYERGGRGFSFRKDEFLDMRLDTSRGSPAAELVARLPERELADMLYRNAGERYSRRIARAIVEARSHSAITGSVRLAEIVERAAPPAYRRLPLHPATRTFQALRAEVNGELSRLQELLEGAVQVLRPGGRIGVISFNHEESRMVKNFFREKVREIWRPSGETPIYRGEEHILLKLVTPKAVSPGEEELRRNPSSRSAKLRVVEKVDLSRDEGEVC